MQQNYKKINFLLPRFILNIFALKRVNTTISTWIFFTVTRDVNPTGTASAEPGEAREMITGEARTRIGVARDRIGVTNSSPIHV